jgi:glycosyltransferase involved in cell wall biosynthesis
MNGHASTKNSKVVINLSSRHVRPTDPGCEGATLWDAQTVRSAFSPRRLVTSVGSFTAAEILVDDRRALLSIKPQLAARLLARGPCVVRDATGSVAIRWRDLARLAWQSLGDARRLRSGRRALTARMAELAVPVQPPRAGAGPPLFLRADLWYGIRAGGSVSHIASVLKAMRSIGWNPVLATPEAVPTIPAATPVLLLTPRPLQVFHSEWRQLLFNLDVVQQVQSAWSEPPPRFVYQRHGLNVIAGLDLAHRWGVPCVLEYNGPELWVAEHWGRPPAEPEWAERAESLALAGADLVIVVSEPLAAMLKERGVAADRILILPNGVDTDLFRPDCDATAFRQRYGIGNRTVIGFIGTFGPWHGVEVLTEAFAILMRDDPGLLGSVCLLLVGDGTRMGAVRDIVDRHGLQHSVVFTGLLPQETGPEAVAAFDIAVAPTVANPDGSAFFGSPTKLFEYMAAGKACVCSALGQVAELIKPGENGLLVPPGDPMALAAALRQLLENLQLRHQLGTAARCDAVRHHSIKRRAQVLASALARFELRPGKDTL